jgi:hypothetical protein
VITTHPLAGLKRLKVDNDERVCFLNPAEENHLRDALVKREARLRAARDRFIAWLACCGAGRNTPSLTTPRHSCSPVTMARG